MVRGLDYATALPLKGLGPRRLVSTPSLSGLARRRLGTCGPLAFAEFDGIHRGVSHPGAQGIYESAALTN